MIAAIGAPAEVATALGTKDGNVRRVSVGLAALLVVVGTVALAPAASANTVTGQGTVTANKYRAGVAANGGVNIAAGVQVSRDATNTIVAVRGAGRISKLSKATVVQIDSIVLGTSTAAVLSKTTPVNSGAATSALSETVWRTVAKGSCASYRVRVSYSVRWTDGALSKFSVLSPLTQVCRPAILPVKYANCTALNMVYPHGVGRPGAKDQSSGVPVTTFTVDLATYNLNTASDRDKDGIACEKL